MPLFSGLNNTVLKVTPLAIHFAIDIMTAVSRIQRFFQRCEVMYTAINTNRFDQFGVSKGAEDLAEETIETSNITNDTPFIALISLSSKLP